MRYIIKSEEPLPFTVWKHKPSKIIKGYKHLRGRIKKQVYESLIREQDGLCAYCERPLIESDREKDYHIDHLNPQHLHAGDDLDYANFICSCLNQTAKGEPLHCGKLKDNEKIPIDPLQEDCQSKFTYTFIGKIVGVTQDAKDTIKILGLDIAKLTDMRKKVLSPFLSDEIEPEEFKSFISGYITPDHDGTRNAFCSMIEFLFQDYIEVR